ncbi:MAG: alcohol dehydrogenase catalytic domain-containing protein [Planctomycetes bacterium]|nr:alcohol dehydrogenase catalytic domain-containing protein [Planctomycetota bacterium]MBI3834929.1 alcohol dehydrogenase catalytic domain-containing protein [Planctomycetota bacterium]
MRAIFFDRTLQFRAQHVDPVPAEGECLIRVHRAGITATDLHNIDGLLAFQGIPGHEFVGVVTKGSPAWKGKRVVVDPNCICRSCDMCQSGLSSHCRTRRTIGIQGRDGGFAELVAVPERNLLELPATIDDDQAVFVHLVAASLQVALQSSFDAQTKVAIVGSGRLGLVLAQVLRVTRCRLDVIGRNPLKLAVCERMGFQTHSLVEIAPRADHDVVVECSGSAKGLHIALQLVRPRGMIVLKSRYFDSAPSSTDLAQLLENEIRLVGSRSVGIVDAIAALARGLIDVRPLISRVVPIEQAIAAFDVARDPRTIKVLFRMDTRYME